MTKKIRSENLYRHLLQKGVLFAPDEVIKEEKRIYRKLYKRNWKRNQLKEKPELRPSFTKSERKIIENAAKNRGLTPTAFVRQSAIAQAENKAVIANKEMLMLILQKVSMAGILVAGKKATHLFGSELIDADKLLLDSESLLMEYLGYGVQDTIEAQPRIQGTD